VSRLSPLIELERGIPVDFKESADKAVEASTKQWSRTLPKANTHDLSMKRYAVMH
jgi:hypothetical protein